MQEYANFKKFTQSLLARSNKISDVTREIESYIAECDLGDSDLKRAKKPLTEINPPSSGCTALDGQGNLYIVYRV